MKGKTKYLALFIALTLALFFIGTAHAAVYTINGDVFTIKIKKQVKKTSSDAIITVMPLKSYHCNIEYPWKLKIIKSLNLTVKKELYTKDNATVYSKDSVVFTVPVAKKKGAGTLNMQLKFSICSETQCFMKTVPLKVSF